MKHSLKPPIGRRPGGPLSSRPLHFIWLADCSGSMGVDGKIQQLNFAIREAIGPMQQMAHQNPNAQVLVRAIAFANDAVWHIEDPMPVDQFRWRDLETSGVTSLGKALKLVTKQLRIPPMSERALPPVLVLISDGQPTDDWKGGLRTLFAEQWGEKAVRLSIAIGHDADLDVLQKFIGDEHKAQLRPLRSNNPEALVRCVRWVSTIPLKAASAPKGYAQTSLSTANVQIPTASMPEAEEGEDVW